MSGRVLCISAGAVARLYYGRERGWFCSDRNELDHFRNLVNSYSLFVERERAEKDTGIVQLIPSCVVATGARILCLQRAATSSRAELRSKWTSLFGGHVDETDKQGASAWKTLLNGAKREVHEELGILIGDDNDPQFAGLAIDPSNRTGRIHLGVIFYYPAGIEEVYLDHSLDLEEFDVHRARAVRFFSPSDVRRVESEFDPWSTLFLRSDYARSHLKSGFEDRDDLPLLRFARI